MGLRCGDGDDTCWAWLLFPLQVPSARFRTELFRLSRQAQFQDYRPFLALKAYAVTFRIMVLKMIFIFSIAPIMGKR